MWSDNLFGGPDLLLQIFIVSNKTNLTNFVLKLWFLFCQCKTQTADSLRSWRYCVGARLKFWRRSRVPKKGSRDEVVERGFAARDRSAVKSPSTILQRLRRQISLDYYTIPPVTQATNYQSAWIFNENKAFILSSWFWQKKLAFAGKLLV